MNRRISLANLFLSLFLASFISIVLCKPAVSANQNSVTHDIDKKIAAIGEYFNGEEFTYDIGFWWFKKAAVGKIGIHRQNDGMYEITLTAETMGFVGFITSYRKDIYRTYAEEIDGGKRFRTKRFEKLTIIGDRKKNSYTEVDYDKGVYHWKIVESGKAEKQATEPISSSVLYDDPLTGFYNFRFGVYGQIAEGKEFSIPAFPAEGISAMSVKIATNEEKAKRLNPVRSLPDKKLHASDSDRGILSAEEASDGVNPDPTVIDYLADATTDKGLFGSRTGKVEIWFNKELIPVAAIAKDIILVGDVRGTLIEMTSSVGFKKINPHFQ